MLSTYNKEAFLALVHLGVRRQGLVHDAWCKVLGRAKRQSRAHGQESVDWCALEELAAEQGLSAILVDGIERLPEEQRPPKLVLLQWIGETLQQEQQYASQQKAASDMASLFSNNYIRTYVLKGRVFAECYPRPEHRFSCDMDCFLRPDLGGFDAWELGNSLIESKGYEVSRDYYKNSTLYLPDLMVENHRFMIPFRGDKKLAFLEKVLQALIAEDKGENRIEGTRLYRPPVMVSALFLIEHAYSHFLSEGLTWRHILDWQMFSEKHQEEIDWNSFYAFVDEFGFRKFYDAYNRLGKYLLGEVQETSFTYHETRMLADVWAPLDLHESLHGFKAKLQLAGNTWRARWKYRYFTDISWVRALFIQVKGFLFIKHPKL